MASTTRPIPSLGYLIEIAGNPVAIGIDQNLEGSVFTRLATDADIMVLPLLSRKLPDPLRGICMQHPPASERPQAQANIDEIRRHHSGRQPGGCRGYCLP